MEKPTPSSMTDAEPLCAEQVVKDTGGQSHEGRRLDDLTRMGCHGRHLAIELAADIYGYEAGSAFDARILSQRRGPLVGSQTAVQQFGSELPQRPSIESGLVELTGGSLDTAPSDLVDLDVVDMSVDTVVVVANKSDGTFLDEDLLDRGSRHADMNGGERARSQPTSRRDSTIQGTARRILDTGVSITEEIQRAPRRGLKQQPASRIGGAPPTLASRARGTARDHHPWP